MPKVSYLNVDSGMTTLDQVYEILQLVNTGLEGSVFILEELLNDAFLGKISIQHQSVMWFIRNTLVDYQDKLTSIRPDGTGCRVEVIEDGGE
jgi:hypothetical protein